MKILLPVDGSEAALDAVRHALRLVREGLGAQLVLANVQEPASLYELLRAHDAEVIENLTRAAGEHSLEAATVLCDRAGVEVETVLGQGEPAHVLADIAEEQGCDLVVMGSRGKGDTPGTRLGSVAHAMLHDSPVPVTIVHPSDFGDA
jgi:nucleotide-binding universal stress UspA family protein